MKYFIGIALLFVSCNVFAIENKIAAIVNDRPITVYEFNARKNMMIKLNNLDVSDAAANHKLNSDILNALIDEELLIQHFAKVGGQLSEADIANAIENIEKKNKMPKGYLMQYLKELGVNVASFRRQVTGELIKYNFVSSLSNSLSVTPKEIDFAVIHSGFEDFDIETWVFTSFDDDINTMKNMEKLKKRLSSCDKVDKKLYNNFADAEKFDRKLKDLEDKTKSVILDTAEGRSSNIYQENGKFKLLLVCTKKPSESGINVNQVRNFISNQKMSKKATKFFKDLKSKAYIEILMKK